MLRTRQASVGLGRDMVLRHYEQPVLIQHRRTATIARALQDQSQRSTTCAAFVRNNRID